LCWNIGGLTARLGEPGFLSYLSPFDICCLLETFTSHNLDLSMYFDDYVLYHCPGIKLSPQGRRSGGVAVLIRKQLALQVCKIQLQYDNVVVFQIQSRRPIIVICAYVPPVDSPYYSSRHVKCNLSFLEDIILELERSYPECMIMICGDLNARIGDWHVHTHSNEYDNGFSEDSSGIECTCDHFRLPRKSQDSTVNHFGTKLIEICRIYHLCVLNGCANSDREGRSTYISPLGESVVDYCLLYANALHYDIDVNVASRIESQHMPLEISLGLRKPPYQKITKTRYISKICWDTSKVREFVDRINEREFSDRLSDATEKLQHSTEEALTIFMEALTTCVEGMRKNITIKYNTALNEKRVAWFDGECRDARRETRKALNRYRTTKLSIDKDKYASFRRQYKSLIREKKIMYRNTVSQSLMTSLTNSRDFWNMIKSATRKVTPPPEIEIDVWKNYFEQIYQHSAETHEDVVPHFEEVIDHPELDAQISSAEVDSAIRRIKTGKAPGLDDLPGECFRTACSKIVPFLTTLFNNLFDTHYFPRRWLESVIVPIHKKGNKLDPDNYRGISLLPILSKIFSSILTRRLCVWLEDEGKICTEQAGFRTDHSTIDHIFTLYAIVTKHVYGQGRGKLYVAFVDYRKAFDSVDRCKLWKILQNSKLSTKFTKMLKAMYANVKSCVRWNHLTSDFFTCPVGVKQGAKESTSIFLMYINTVADYVRAHGRHGIQMLPGKEEIFALLFADDIALLSSTPSGLQNQINSLARVSETLGLRANTDKTKVMVFRRGGHLAGGERWFLGDTRLEIVNSYKYLGYTFTTKLSLSAAAKDVAIKGKLKSVQIMKAMWSLQNTNTTVFARLFDAQVQSSLLYGSEIWGLRTQDPVEKTQVFACKRFLGLDIRTPNHFVYGELGRYPLVINSTIRAIKYWIRLSTMPSQRLPRQAYEMLQNTRVAQDKSWPGLVKHTLCKLGFAYVWLNGGVGNQSRFLKQLKQRLKDCYRQSWDEKNHSNERFLWYSSFKDVFGQEKYLNFLHIKKFRDTFIRFRLGINTLRINQRFAGNETRDLTCPFCNVIENEDHFLVYCCAYDELREKYMIRHVHPHTRRNSSVLVEGSSTRMTRDVSMYIFYALKLREEKITSSIL